jgi:hypothetical protein
LLDYGRIWEAQKHTDPVRIRIRIPNIGKKKKKNWSLNGGKAWIRVRIRNTGGIFGFILLSFSGLIEECSIPGRSSSPSLKKFFLILDYLLR